MKYRFGIEARTNMHANSATYGRVFGWSVVNAKRNEVVRTFLLCETGLMLTSYPFTDKQVERTEDIARANGWDGKG